jgi:hypothetical protein
MIPGIMTTRNAEMAVAPPATEEVRTRGDFLSRSSLWWYLGLLAPARPSPVQTQLPTRTSKASTGITSESEDSDIWRQDNTYQLQIGVVVALPSAPGKGSNGRSPDARMGDNVEGEVEGSTGYCIGTASCPIRIDAG